METYQVCPNCSAWTHIPYQLHSLAHIVASATQSLTIKGSDRQCKVVELSMQSCGKIRQDLFETYETVTRSINPKFERKVDVQTQYIWVDTFSELVFFKLLNNDDEKSSKNYTVN